MKSLISLWEHYSSKSTQPNNINFSLGILNTRVLNQSNKFILQSLKRIVKKHKSDNLILDYTQPQGLDCLLSTLNKIYPFQEKNNFIVTQGAQQALSIIFQALVNSQDKIMIDNSNYIGLQQLIINQNGILKCFSKPLHHLSIPDLKSNIEEFKPKIIYLNPDFSNPTGNTLPIEKRQVIANLANKYSITIIEDQTYRSLIYQPENQLPSLKEIYPLTISVNTISKTIASGLRIGWINASPKHFQLLLNQKKATDLFTPPITQLILNSILENPLIYQKHLKKVRLCCQQKMSTLVRGLINYFPSTYTWNIPLGGFFIWVEGPKSLDSRKLLKKAIKNNISFMPGFIFSYYRNSHNAFRLSISYVSNRQIKQGIKRLSQLLPR